jgi:hypothetical protein
VDLALICNSDDEMSGFAAAVLVNRPAFISWLAPCSSEVIVLGIPLVASDIKQTDAARCFCLRKYVEI